MGQVGLLLYRSLLKQCRYLGQSLDSLYIKRPIEGEWGTSQTGYLQRQTNLGTEAEALPDLCIAADQLDVLEELVPGLEETPQSFPVKLSEIRRLIRANFKLHKEANVKIDVDYTAIDQGFKALRALPYLAYLERGSSRNFEEGVLVEVCSSALPDRFMERGKSVYPFSYRVRVTNLRKEHIQLMGRQWTIVDQNQTLVAVVPPSRSNGLVGQQPYLPPGAYFEYYSGTPLPTPSGFMVGALLIDVCKGPEDGNEVLEEIEVPIARFRLLQPDP